MVGVGRAMVGMRVYLEIALAGSLAGLRNG
jgi:hypothetical protein